MLPVNNPRTSRMLSQILTTVLPIFCSNEQHSLLVLVSIVPVMVAFWRSRLEVIVMVWNSKPGE
jgi:hypothetical protein